MKSLLLATAFLSVTLASEFTLTNNCPFTIWPGIQGNPFKDHLMSGGFELGQYQSMTLQAPNDWAGRFWGRTNCNSGGACETGDCGGKIECNGNGGAPPASLAEITLKGASGLDFYDISFVDGFNLPIQIKPKNGYVLSGGGQYDCQPSSCNVNLNAMCPNELTVKRNDGTTIGCNSACNAFHTDQYCCSGAHNTPETCKASDWPVNYPKYFKDACPDAYSYAYDDHKSTFTCRGDPNANYEVVFCP